MATDYNILYTQLVDGVYEYVTAPTEVGVYFISVEFVKTGTSDAGTDLYNYYHAGTIVSTGKQIGALYIYAEADGAPTTYKVSFVDENGATVLDASGDAYDIAAALPQTIHVLPTLDESKYSGWETSEGISYSFSSRFAQPAYDVTFTAVEREADVTISGTATGTDLDGTENAPLSGVGVALMSGNEQIAVTETGNNGTYSFDVTPGRYTIVFTRAYGNDDPYEESFYVDATAANVMQNVTIPDGRYNITLSLDAGMEAITVDGLQDILNELTINKTVENSVVFNINQVDVTSEGYLAILTAAATDGLTSDNIKLFYDIQITEEKTLGNVTNVDVVGADGSDADTQADELFACYIPLEGMYQGKESYTVYYRYYDASANDGAGGYVTDKLTTTPNNDGAYIDLADERKTLVIYANQSAMYAISFPVDAPETLVGTDKEVVYSAGSIDLATLGMFDLTNRGTPTYTITNDASNTGVGTLEGTSLTVGTVGTFTISVSTPATGVYAAVQGSATLTVTPAGVTISDLVAVDRDAIQDYTSVALDTTATATLTGIVNDDTVRINYSTYAADITDEDYANSETLEQYGSEAFTVEVSGLTLTGADAGNYYVKSIEDTDVTITKLVPVVTAPTASNIIYGALQDTSVLTGGSVVFHNANGTTTVVAGVFTWQTPSENVQDVGSYTGTAIFTPNDAGYAALYTNITCEVTYTVEQKPVTLSNLVAVSRDAVLNDYAVDLDATVAGSINGMLANDDVSIDYTSDYTATITDTNYANDAGLANGSESFAVEVAGLTLTGTDASNYYITKIADTSVTITKAVVAIAAPDASNITYGALQDTSALTGGSVVLYNADGTTTTLTGTFAWQSPSDEIQDADTYTDTVVFTITGVVGDADADVAMYQALYPNITSTATYTVEPKEVTITALGTISRGLIEGDYYVSIDETTGEISNAITGDTASATGNAYTDAVLDGDDVAISYTHAYGRITIADYYDYSEHTEDYQDGKATFAVEVGGIELTGTDKDNYTIVLVKDTTVEINITIPYIAWPASEDINYHDSLSDDDLYGGKVIVYDSAKDEYVTIDGEFIWLDTEYWVDANGNYVDATGAPVEEENEVAINTTEIGTYTQYVKFVESEKTQSDDNSYNAALVATTHAVSVIIKATSVTFTVTNNDKTYTGNAQYADVTATVSNHESNTFTGVTSTDNDADYSAYDYDYIIRYYQFVDGKVVYIEEPTEVGTYFISGEFTTENYHHAGTLESTGKQIGVFNIIAQEAAATPTYSVTFVDDSGVVYGTLGISGALAQSIHILPTLTDDADGDGYVDYIGWSYNGVAYDFGARFAQPTSNVTLVAIPAPDTYTLTGTVVGQDLDGYYNAKLSDIGVAIMQGSEIIATGETDADGEFSFNLPAGYYTVVITRDQIIKNEVTLYVEIKNADVEMDEIDLPDVPQNTVLEIDSGVVVDTATGLEDLLDYYLKQDGTDYSNTITVAVDSIDMSGTHKTEYETIMKAADKAGLTTDNLKLFFDITVVRDYMGNTTEINTIPGGNYIEFYIALPGTYQGDYDYQVYRYHEDAAEENGYRVDILTTEPNEYGEYITLLDGGQTLKVTAMYYSIYGVAFTDAVSDSPSNNASNESIIVTETATTVPQTSDLSRTGLWLAMAAVFAFGMFCTRKKRAYKHVAKGSTGAHKANPLAPKKWKR